MNRCNSQRDCVIGRGIEVPGIIIVKCIKRLIKCSSVHNNLAIAISMLFYTSKASKVNASSITCMC